MRSAGSTRSTSGTGAGRRRVPITRMPSVAAMRATFWPMTPTPRMPSVLPVSGSGTIRTHLALFWFSAAAA